MNIPVLNMLNPCRTVFIPLLLSLAISGCTHVGKEAPSPAVAEKMVNISTVMERRGDVAGAVEDLKIALAIDPGNAKARENLDRMIEKRGIEAKKHYMAGLASRDPREARKEFVNTLRLRPDHGEAITALRGLQLTSQESAIEARLRREAAHTSIRTKPKAQAGEEEQDMGSYSLDIAVSAFNDGDYATAIREFSKMKARYPGDRDIQEYLVNSWYNFGVAQFNSEHYSKALESFLKVPKGFGNAGDYIRKCRKAMRGGAGRKKTA